MFERHIVSDNQLTLPLSGNRYKIDCQGKVSSLEDEPIETTSNSIGEPVVYINYYEGWKKYRVAMLVALAFKPILVNESLWHRLDVLYLDGDVKNIHPRNLVWKFPIGLENPKYKGFAYIPCFTRYSVSVNGDLISNFTGQRIKQFQYDPGYVQYSTIRPDIGYKTTLHRHRAVCLAWTDYPVNIDEMTVNHIDGVPGNDDLNNLEWLTYEDNFKHAMRIGLSKAKPIESVFVRNCKTLEITEYGSCDECGTDLGLNYQEVHYRCRKKNQSVWPGYLQFQFGHSLEPWRDPHDVERELSVAVNRDAVLTRDVTTLEIKEYPSASECALALGYVVETVNVRLRDGVNQPVYRDGYQFQRKVDYVPWRHVIDPVAEVEKAHTNREVYVRDIFTKEEWYFVSILACCDGLKVPSHVVMDRKDNRFNYPWFNLEFKFENIPWREYSNEDYEIFKDAIEERKAFRGRGYVLTNVSTGEKKFYAFITKVMREFGLKSRTSLLELATAKKVLRKEWRIEPHFEN